MINSYTQLIKCEDNETNREMKEVVRKAIKETMQCKDVLTLTEQSKLKLPINIQSEAANPATPLDLASVQDRGWGCVHIPVHCGNQGKKKFLLRGLCIPLFTGYTQLILKSYDKRNLGRTTIVYICSNIINAIK
ncbi:hypothetical protein TNCT_401961 [Trichonephila clavata]|uniref:Uncharacterized protein n=1 Tax=Trichonephila clavata TaxID=2740835 RepID=A0A8X6LC47_TRICU|nr:hypothetical protein TNCT_401961 [Trichonephila clavata]